MPTHSLRIPEELANRLEVVSKATKRTKTSVIVEAIERHLDEQEDLEIALSRFRDPGTEWVDHEDVLCELNLS
jgi:predicted DNA-binding protein